MDCSLPGSLCCVSPFSDSPSYSLCLNSDITNLVSKSECYCLNEEQPGSHNNLFVGDDRLGLKSDADEQLLLHVQFNEMVKLHSIRFTAFNSAAPDMSMAPKTVKIFVNRPNMGFSDAEDVNPTQEFELTEGDLTGDGGLGIAKDVRFVKFQRVSSISILVEENFGADITAIGGIRFFGMPINGTNMDDFKKQGEGD